MRWTERQLAMLREMGIRVWSQEAAAGEMAHVAIADADSPSVRRDLSPAPTPAPTVDRPLAQATSVQARERGETDRAGAPSGPARLAGSPVADAPATAGAASGMPLGPADWLIVTDPSGVAGEGGLGGSGRAETPGTVASADEERLLVAMLRAVRVSFDAPTPAGRATRLVVDPGLRERLAEVLETVRPKVVLAFGRAAAETLVGAGEPLGRLRGRAHALDHVALVVTFAPSYLLRHPAEKAKAWADLCLAARLCEAPPASG